MDLSGDMPVTLVIKAPNQRMADQTVDCMLGWTIKKLKQHLENVYPTKPKHNEQRLIYSGRLLQDHLTLKEVLRQYDTRHSNRHTVHLVCSSVMDSNSFSSPSVSFTSGIPAQAGKASSSSTENTPSENINSGKSEGVRHRGPSQLSEPRGSLGSPTSTPAPYQSGLQGDMPAYSPEQYAWMMQQHQLYSQYMMQYMMYYQNMCNTGLSFNPQMPTSLTQQHVGNSLPQQPPPALEAAAAANNGVQGGARANVRMNAQGGMEEEDEDGEPRDWLHHMYFFMRILTFMGILFFYSNMTRFLIVFAGSFAIYILQKVRKYMQRAQQQHDQAQQQNEQVEQQHGQDNQEQVEQQQEHLPTEARNEEVQDGAHQPLPDTDSGQQQIPEDESSRLTRILVFICHTVQTFFTSLLPTPPELLEPN